MNVDITISLKLKHNNFYIHIYDKNVGEEIMQIELSTDQFAKFITGQEIDEINAEISNINTLGKRKIVDFQNITCPIMKCDEDYDKWIKDNNLIKDGWELSHICSIHYTNPSCVTISACIKKYEDII